MATPRMQSALAFGVLAILASAGPAVSGCPQANSIARAFEPNVEYYAQKSGVDRQSALNKLDSMAGGGVGCTELYNQYNHYLNDLVDQSSPKFGFQKW